MKSNNIQQNALKKANFKTKIDLLVKFIFAFLALICACVVIFIVIFILVKGIQPFIIPDGNGATQNVSDFFLNPNWLYDGTGGMSYMMLATIYVTLLSLIISVPTSIFCGLFIVKVCPKSIKEILKTGVQILASIPSVIFGLFGMGVLKPIVKGFANAVGMQTFGGSSVLTGVLVLAFMTIPTITLVSITSMEAVDINLSKASLALGASNQQTNYKIVLKASQSGIFAGTILGIGRALGEATALQMVIGNGGVGWDLLNVFNIYRTLTTTMLAGIGEATGIKYDIRFSLGIVLIIVIVVTNILLNLLKNYMTRIDKGEPKDKNKIGIIKNIKIYLEAYVHAKKKN